MDLIELLREYANVPRNPKNETKENIGMSEDEKENLEERAAIMEFDGGLNEKDAEKCSEINMKLSKNNQY